MPLNLHVCDRDGLVIGKVPARIGLVTSAGRLARMTEKTIWCVGKSGYETMYRYCDGQLPSVTKSRAGKHFVPAAPKS